MPKDQAQLLKGLVDLLSTKKNADDLLKSVATVVDIFKTLKDATEADRAAVLQTLADVTAKANSIQDGIDGKDGRDGRNPLSISQTQPLNPQPGDLWYQP